ncbi:hypothetical protein AURDEDRAFT_113866 [Auricularia subglabra TFB-10046 SS5]|nr:hypothetical protein AURDEDRAFT_113866 [Auricularia subglabra TFB-10046 SS5]
MFFPTSPERPAGATHVYADTMHEPDHAYAPGIGLAVRSTARPPSAVSGLLSRTRRPADAPGSGAG